MNPERIKYHRKIEEGLSPSQIAEMYDVSEFHVVKVLRCPKPKIKGVNYTHLSYPISQEEIERRHENGSLDEYANELGVSKTTLLSRIPHLLVKRRVKKGEDRKSKYNREVSEDLKDRFMSHFSDSHNISSSADAVSISVHFAKKIIEERRQKIGASTFIFFLQSSLKLVADEGLDARVAYRLSEFVKRLPVDLLSQEGLLFRWIREGEITFAEADIILDILEKEGK